MIPQTCASKHAKSQYDDVKLRPTKKRIPIPLSSCKWEQLRAFIPLASKQVGTINPVTSAKNLASGSNCKMMIPEEAHTSNNRPFFFLSFSAREFGTNKKLDLPT
jgi:hypothetical protein